jgi:hypothetical protein
MAMKAENVNIVWTPDTDLYRTNPTRGLVDVVLAPDSGDPRQPNCYGVCAEGWEHATEDERMRMVQCMILEMRSDGISVERIREAITKIDEYRHFPFTV